MTHEDWLIINRELHAVQMALAGLSERVLALEKEKEDMVIVLYLDLKEQFN